jgi:hypothetical protein
LGKSESWPEGGELRDVAVDEFHFEGSEVVGVGHLVRVLDNEVRVGVRLAHEGELFLKHVDGDDVVHCVRERGNGVESLNVILDNGDHC